MQNKLRKGERVRCRKLPKVVFIVPIDATLTEKDEQTLMRQVATKEINDFMQLHGLSRPQTESSKQTIRAIFPTHHLIFKPVYA